MRFSAPRHYPQHTEGSGTSVSRNTHTLLVAMCARSSGTYQNPRNPELCSCFSASYSSCPSEDSWDVWKCVDFHWTIIPINSRRSSTAFLDSVLSDLAASFSCGPEAASVRRLHFSQVLHVPPGQGPAPPPRVPSVSSDHSIRFCLRSDQLLDFLRRPRDRCRSSLRAHGTGKAGRSRRVHSGRLASYACLRFRSTAG